MDQVPWNGKLIVVWHDPSDAPFIVRPMHPFGARHKEAEGKSAMPLYLVDWPQSRTRHETARSALLGCTAWAAVEKPQISVA